MTGKLNQIFAAVLDISPSEISDEVSFDSVDNWDSMSHMILINQLEETFNIELTGDEIADIKSVADAKKALAARGINL